MHKYTHRFYELLEEIKALHDKKRHDYAQEADPFANFRLSELGGIDAWKGIAVRLGDKYSRLMSFIQKGKLKYNDESIKDTLMDNAVYSLIALILYEEAQEKNEQMTFSFYGEDEKTASVASTTQTSTFLNDSNNI
tara:strand:- start:60 stop:467 length:408 start_codon:yes stop_codon:yes gene_type:complete